MNRQTDRRIFMGLMFAACVGINMMSWLIWRIAYPGLGEIWTGLPTVVGILLIVAGGFVTLTVVNLALAVMGLPASAWLKKQSYVLINILFPLIVYFGKWLGVERRRLEGAFVGVSNILFSQQHWQVPARDVLVMTPHCLQLVSCPHKITRDVQNCKRCGGCNIGDLVKLADEMGFFLFVATGGTLARQIIKEHRPKIVLAIACERDLMSGIRDVYPLPAIGVLNLRPNGPCYNTKVNMDDVKNALSQIIIEEANTLG